MQNFFNFKGSVRPRKGLYKRDSNRHVSLLVTIDWGTYQQVFHQRYLIEMFAKNQSFMGRKNLKLLATFEKVQILYFSVFKI